MKSFVALGLAAVALAAPQSSAPSGCSPSASGTFQITTVNVTNSKRSLQSRQLSGVLTLSLNNGNLKDQAGRTGYIASNYQFQFDAPVQAGARETTGFSLCSNMSLALGGSTMFYSCNSGNFYNLYSQSTGAQCIPIHIQAVMGGGSGASQASDGQPQATAPAVSQISDGQPQASSAKPAVSQISDGQPQGSKPLPAATSKPAVVTQISDGQPQASKPQPQTSKPAVVSQISDGQPQASKPAVVSQISDGQPQASAPVGNLTRPSPNATSPSIPAFTGGATTSFAGMGAVAAGLFGLFALL